VEEGASFGAGNDLLPPDLCDSFMARARLLNVRSSQIIITEGSEADDVYLVRTGKVRISLFSFQGREMILRETRPGELFGELAAIDRRPRSASATATEDSLLAHLRGDQFIDFLANVPKAGLWMAQRLAARVRDLTDKASDLVAIPVAGRIQGELLRLAQESGSAGFQTLIKPMPTHADIAARIGTHREAVTRELNLLAKENIIQQSGRTVEILAPDKLRAHYDRFRRS
jgi:CRP/FNR family cyclic AMP-dependent transcriptional regulator